MFFDLQNKKVPFIAVIALLVGISTHAQVVYPENDGNQNSNQTVSVEALSVEEVQASIPMYEKLLRYNPTSSKLHYQLGFCYINSVLDKDKALGYFEDAMKYMKEGEDANNAPVEVYFYLSRSYRLAGKYVQAYDALQKLEAVTDKENKQLLADINTDMEIVKDLLKNGKVIIKTSVIRKLYANAEFFIEEQNYDQAIKEYKKLLMIDDTNSEFNYKIGLCYLNTIMDKHLAIDFFLKAIINISTDRKRRKYNAPIETYYYLGQAYRVNYNFEEALNSFDFLKDSVPENEVAFHKLIDHEIKLCENVKMLKNRPIELYIAPVVEVNSEYTDHSPVFTLDQQTMFYTSRRKNSAIDRVLPDGEYDEDIYVSHRDAEGRWGTPVPISRKINSSKHEATISVSANGRELYIYKDDNGDGNIYISRMDTLDKWTKPVKLGPTINTSAMESHASISAGGQRLYFSSDRKGGFGGKDIYVVRKLNNGQWSKAENLGETINTPFDEEGPFIHADEVTLYFSSQGHNNMGGFDIFKTELDSMDNWKMPINVGFPINTPQDDVFFVLDQSGKFAYYASEREDGMGGSDVYKMTLPEDDADSRVLVKGKVSICTGVLPAVQITIQSGKTGEIIGRYKPNSKTGKFLFVLHTGYSYFIKYKADGKQFKRESLEIPIESSVRDYKRDIKLRSGTGCDEEFFSLLASAYFFDDSDEGFINQGIVYDEKIEIKNILFPFGKANKIKANKDLDILASYLKENAKAIIEIGAFADAVGAAEYNKRLTEKRANVVVKYLTDRGAKKGQLVSVGYGEENPIARNQNPDGSWNKEAQKYNRRIEFIVIKQGLSKIWVDPVIEMPEAYRVKKEDNEPN